VKNKSFRYKADDGDTVEKALKNVRGAIQTYVDSLITTK